MRRGFAMIIGEEEWKGGRAPIVSDLEARVGGSMPETARGEGRTPLSVLLLNPTGGEGWGGVEKWMLALSDHLVRRGHRVASCAKDGSRWAAACREHGHPTTELGMRGDFHPRDLLVLRRLYRQLGIDLVLVKMRQCLRMAWAARLLVWGRGPAILCRLGGIETKQSLGARLSYRYMADLYVSPSAHARDELLRHGGFRPEQVRVIPNGVEIPRDDPAARTRVRAELGLGDDPVLIVTGRLHPVKGHGCLLEALGMLRTAFPGLRLLIVGEGSERGRLQEWAERLGLGRAVVFTGFRSDVMGLLRAADVFVLPSLQEGMPNAALEAMAVGLPVVASATGGMAEVVAEGETGLLVPPSAPCPLSEAIGRLLREPGTARAMGQAGLERVRELFGLERMLAASEACCIETRDARPTSGA